MLFGIFKYMPVYFAKKLKKFKMEVDAYGNIIKSNDTAFIAEENKRIARAREAAEKARASNEKKAS